MKKKIFISYSRKDEEYFKVFKSGIESHSKNIKWKIWSDKDIPVGALWHHVIQKEIKDCDAAILLVSANFLTSDYIKEKEFLKFLERSKQDGFTFFPILLDDCDFTQWEELPERQFFNPKGEEYEVYNTDGIMPYSRLVKFNQSNGIVLLNSNRETYHKKCVKAIEKVIHKKEHPSK